MVTDVARYSEKLSRVRRREAAALGPVISLSGFWFGWGMTSCQAVRAAHERWTISRIKSLRVAAGRFQGTQLGL